MKKIITLSLTLLVFAICILKASGQYIEPVKIDFYEQAGIMLDWPDEIADEYFITGNIQDGEKFTALGIPYIDLMSEEVNILINNGDKWDIVFEIDTNQYKLLYKPGYWEVYHGYDRIGERLSARFNEICDLTGSVDSDDDYEILDVISRDGFFTDTKMMMFGTAWPGINDDFKYEQMKNIETGDDVTLIYFGDYTWKYIFPENDLEIKVVYTPGYLKLN